MARHKNRLRICIWVSCFISLNIILISRFQLNWPLNAIQLSPVIIKGDKAEFVMSLNSDDLLDVLEAPIKDVIPTIPEIVLHNTLLCSQSSSNLDFVLYVHSAAANSDRRQALRSTYANPTLFRRIRFQVVFFLGLSKVIGMQERIKEEFNEYGDIVQGNFIENYKNMTLKAILAISWISRYCSQANYAMKIDDDAFVNLFEMISLMERNLGSPLVVICPLWPDRSVPVLRSRKSCMKWCVTNRQFPASSFPQYCAGLTYTLSRALIQRLVEAIDLTPFFWIDDVYITGLLLLQNATIADVRFVTTLHLMELDRAKALQMLANASVPITKYLFHTNSSQMLVDMWQLLLKRLTMEQKEMIQLPVAATQRKP